MLSGLLYADNLLMSSETIEGLIKWKKAFKRNGLKLTLGKAKVIVSECITMNSMSKS